MGIDFVGKRWDAARAKAREVRPWPRDEQDALALIYHLITAHEAVAVEDISTHSVRYRIEDLFVLQQHLAELIPSPRSGQRPPDIGEVMAERAGARLTEAGADQDEFSGPTPVQGRIWRVWNSMQAAHLEDREDTLMSDEVGITLAEEHRWRDTGANLFEHAVGSLRNRLDRDLLSAGGHPSLGAEVEVTAGVHAGRTGSVSAVTWQADHEQCTIGAAPESFTVLFDDLYESIGIPAGEVSALPQWDRSFVIVHAGEPFPTQWHASILLSDPAGKSLGEQDMLDALRDAWTNGFERLVVFIPRQADGSPMTDEHREWASRAVSRADAILARCPADAPAPLQVGPLPDVEAAAVCGRLVILVPGGEPSPPLNRWLERYAVPLSGNAADAAATVLKRTGRGRQRKGGERDVPLLVARSTGYFGWSSALRDARKTLVGADIEWLHRGDDAGHPVVWWSMRARVRHADHRVTSELLVCHAMMASVVAYRRRERWTDCEVILIPCDNSLSNVPVRNAPKGTSLRLPTVVTDFSSGSDTRTRRQQALYEAFGIADIDTDRLRSLGGRNDSSLLAAQRGVAVLELSEDELTFLRSRGSEAISSGPGSTAVVHRLADLLAEPICDWATLGAITRAVMPASPPTSGDFYTGRM